MRASTLLNAVLELPGVRVSKAAVVGGEVRVTVRLRRRRLGCPRCGFSTRHRYDTRDVDSSWRHLDMAGRVCRIQLRRRRLRCGARRADRGGAVRPGRVRPHPRLRGPGGVAGHQDRQDHGRRLRPDRGAPSARSANGSRPTCSTRTGCAAGRHRCRRDLLAQTPPVFDLGVRPRHRQDHRGKPGKDTDTLNAFFDELPDGAEAIEAVSMDMGRRIPRRCGNARRPRRFASIRSMSSSSSPTRSIRCAGRVWQAARTLPDQRIAKAFKGARWALLKNPWTSPTRKPRRCGR